MLKRTLFFGNPYHLSTCNLQLQIAEKEGMYEHCPSEIWELSQKQLLGRLYEVNQLVTEASEIKLLFHQEAREMKEITEFMGLKKGMKGGKNIHQSEKFPWIKINPNKFDCLVEGYDFKVTLSSQIQKL